jgi:hypothetical protein
MGLFTKFIKKVESNTKGFIKNVVATVTSPASVVKKATGTIVKAGFDVYVKQLRSKLSSQLYWIIRNTRYRSVRVPKVWESYKKLSKAQFLLKMKEMPYRGEPLGGAVDYTIQEPDFFFWKGLDKGRDCDDFAYIWWLWAKNKQYICDQIILMNGMDITTSHVITVFYDGTWNLCNNQYLTSGYKTMEAAINGVKNYTWKGAGATTHHYENLYWVKY